MAAPALVSGSPTTLGGNSGATTLTLTMAQNVNTSSTTNGVLLRLYLNTTTSQTISFSDGHWVTISAWSTSQTLGIYFRPNQSGDTNNLGTVTWTTSLTPSACLEEWTGVNLQSPDAGNGYAAGALGSTTYNAPTPSCTVNNSTPISTFATAVRTAISSIAAGFTQLSNNLGANNQSEAQYSTTAVNSGGSSGGSITFGSSAASKVFSVTNYLAPMPIPSASPSSLTFASPGAGSQNSTISGGTTPYDTTVTSSNSAVATGTLSGTTVTVTPAGVGSCTLTVTDAQDQTCTISVTVNAGSSLSVAPSNILIFTRSNDTNCAISGGTSPYSAVTSNGAVAACAVSGSTLIIAPVGVGSATITVTDSASNQFLVQVQVILNTSTTGVRTFFIKQITDEITGSDVKQTLTLEEFRNTQNYQGGIAFYAGAPQAQNANQIQAASSLIETVTINGVACVANGQQALDSALNPVMATWSPGQNLPIAITLATPPAASTTYLWRYMYISEDSYLGNAVITGNASANSIRVGGVLMPSSPSAAWELDLYGTLSGQGLADTMAFDVRMNIDSARSRRWWWPLLRTSDWVTNDGVTGYTTGQTLTSTWSNGIGPGSGTYSIYGGLRVGLSNYFNNTSTGYKGVALYAAGTPAATQLGVSSTYLYGVDFGPTITTGGGLPYYGIHRKQTPIYLGILAGSTAGVVQFMRIPFLVTN